MMEAQERRAVPRTRLAERPAARVRGLGEVRLLDLSLAGVQSSTSASFASAHPARSTSRRPVGR